ncbi:hypothetical protein [Hyalangium rubrum]|uniref:Lipoprotein n=1 Tax=Hyalangium rubrum TaxID=3103134 RepID=A0ABU5GVK1_9BACT|nr:hypothetical protein [Hyalangium sp. s54d21]MDY7225213.1 hypothetical protein [Hyalangium sp. s54d21]
MKRLLLLAALAGAGCYSTDGKIDGSSLDSDVGSFRVEVKGIYTVTDTGANRTPLSVVSSCSARYGSPAEVPVAVRGTPDCRYAIPKSAMDIDLAITALDRNGEPLTSFNGPVSFRVVPGNLSGPYETRWKQLENGQGDGTVRVKHLYGEVRVWVQDEPPQLEYSDGGIRYTDGGVRSDGGDPNSLPQDSGTHSYATGLTAPVYFEEPTLARVQEPEVYNDNRISPFSGQFLTVGRPPESGTPLLQNCPPGYDSRDPSKKDPNDGKLATLVVTGTDPGGFFVTDLTACKVREYTGSGSNVRTPEPTGFMPGTYGSIYIYNYSFPEGLYPGDLLWSISGSVQEFTATTQLTFPAWIIREKVRELPPAEWEKYLNQLNVVELNLRHCGLDNLVAPYVTDSLCGYSYGNLKMESMESALVKLRRVRMPEIFENCDTNGDGSVPFFCPGAGGAAYTYCGEENQAEIAERTCNINCIVGLGKHAGKVCAERNTYNGFGQFVVEMAAPGPREAGFDDSLDRRTQVITVSPLESRATPTAITTGVNGPAQVRVWCDTPVRVKFGTASVRATIDDVPLAAKAVMEHTMTGTEQFVAVLADGDVINRGQCHVSLNSRTRINVVTRDAVPDLVVDCNENDSNADAAKQCQLLRTATYNITGHLRQVSAARPRWIISPRDADDVCCFPGPEGACPRPIKQCPAE